jgi:DNA-binding MarR family transcriptional regulator
LGAKININDKLLAYIRYLKVEGGLNQQHELDAIQIELLNSILLASSEGKMLKVGDILMFEHVASPATLHAALQKLISKGLVSHRLSRDSRAKYLELTQSGLDRYKQLASAQSIKCICTD